MGNVMNMMKEMGNMDGIQDMVRQFQGLPAKGKKK